MCCQSPRSMTSVFTLTRTSPCSLTWLAPCDHASHHFDSYACVLMSATTSLADAYQSSNYQQDWLLLLRAGRRLWSPSGQTLDPLGNLRDISRPTEEYRRCVACGRYSLGGSSDAAFRCTSVLRQLVHLFSSLIYRLLTNSYII